MVANGAEAVTKTVQKLYKLCNSFRCNCYGAQWIVTWKVYIFGFAIKNGIRLLPSEVPLRGTEVPTA